MIGQAYAKAVTHRTYIREYGGKVDGAIAGKHYCNSMLTVNCIDEKCVSSTPCSTLSAHLSNNFCGVNAVFLAIFHLQTELEPYRTWHAFSIDSDDEQNP